MATCAPFGNSSMKHEICSKVISRLFCDIGINYNSTAVGFSMSTNATSDLGGESRFYHRNALYGTVL